MRCFYGAGIDLWRPASRPDGGAGGDLSLPGPAAQNEPPDPEPVCLGTAQS